MVPDSQLAPLRAALEARRKATACAKCGTPYSPSFGQRRCLPCRQVSRRNWKRGAKARERAERRLGHLAVQAMKDGMGAPDLDRLLRAVAANEGLLKRKETPQQTLRQQTGEVG